MIMLATPTNSVPILFEENVPEENLRILVVSCIDYDEYRKLPAAVEYDGQEFGRTGWNSDYGQAYFKSPSPFAYARPVR
jgi:hypothetical protein